MKTNLEFRQITGTHDDFTDDDDLIDSILESRGVSDLGLYKNLKNNLEIIEEINPYDLFNMKEAVEALQDAIREEKNIGILVDGDADGFSSASMMKMYLNKVYRENKISILSLPFKAHGLSQSLELIENANVDFLIIPDSASNDFEEQQLLVDKGIEVVIIDHHDIDEQDKALISPAIIVNNMMLMNKNTNVNFVGAGMVYQYAKALDEVFNVGIKDLLPLFAIGQIADMSDVSDYEVRKNVILGYEEMKNHPFFSKVFTEFEIENMSPHKLAFELIPKINAVSRVGDIDERIELIKVFSESYDPSIILDIKRRRKNPKTSKMEMKDMGWNHYDLELDLIKKIKARQDNIVKKSVASLEYISSPSDGIMIGIMDDEQPMALSGLIANKIISKYSMPAFVVRERDNLMSGSMRCPGEFEFRTWLNETGLASSQGHEQAAGVEFDIKNLDGILEKTKTLDIAKDFYEVDRIYDKNSVNVSDIERINNNLELFGGRVSEPVFGFEGIPIEKNKINVRGSVITFSYNGLTFLMYNGNWFNEWLVSTGFQQEFYFDLYGTPSENAWNNRVTQQIILNDISLSDKVVETPEDDEYDF